MLKQIHFPIHFVENIANYAAQSATGALIAFLKDDHIEELDQTILAIPERARQNTLASCTMDFNPSVDPPQKLDELSHVFGIEITKDQMKINIADAFKVVKLLDEQKA